MNWFKKHKILTVLLIIILLAVVGGALGGGGDDQSTSRTEPEVKKETAQEAGLGQTARDGKFEFTVNGVECGKPNIGSEYLTKAAQGQYCLLNVAVKNIGDEAQSLFSDNQYLLNAGGQKFSADDAATIYASSDPTSGWYSEINPGNTVNGVIVFDLPKDQAPASAELHDSAFSGGVKIKL